MAVRVHTSRDLAAADGYDGWVAVGGIAVALPPERARTGLADALEGAFDAAADDWFALARELAGEPHGDCAHAAACAANVSDMGLMLAWIHLIDDWVAEAATTLVVCDDPWLFRAIAAMPGTRKGRAPPLIRREAALRIRGLTARVGLALRLVHHAIVLRGHRRRGVVGAAALLVYGHPASTADGDDAYFGALMHQLPELTRVLHVDCPASRARALARDERTVSLHGWGSPISALGLIGVRWRVRRSGRVRRPRDWIVRRAVATEGGTAQAAIIRWQDLCQRAWLRQARPAVVAWPWENHAWERGLVRQARALRIATLGYQHSVVGRQMLNHAPAANRDGVDSIPDAVFCVGAATRDRLAGWGVPADRLHIAGAVRFQARAVPAHDPAAPVFLALPFDHVVAAEMVAAARRAARTGFRFLVKDHPMTPFALADDDGVRRTELPLERQDRVAAVVYAASTVGLEAVLGGLPTLRFVSGARIATDILPDGVEVATVDEGSLAAALACPPAPPAVASERIFAPVDMDLWRRYLGGGDAIAPSPRTGAAA